MRKFCKLNKLPGDIVPQIRPDMVFLIMTLDWHLQKTYVQAESGKWYQKHVDGTL